MANFGTLFRHAFLVGLIGLIGWLVGCTSDATKQEEEDAQRVADSLAQAKADSIILAQYILDNNLDQAKLDTASSGIIYGVMTEGNGEVPEINQIVSVNYIGRFTDNSIFDTSIESLAFETDSLAWVERGIDFTAEEIVWADSTFDNSAKSAGDVLTFLAGTEDPLDLAVWSIRRSYSPIIFNYTKDGRFIGSSFLVQFRNGLNLLMNGDENGNNRMDLNSWSKLLMPSAAAYGTVGTPTPPVGEDPADYDQVIEENTVILFDFQMINIRQ